MAVDLLVDLVGNRGVAIAVLILASLLSRGISKQTGIIDNRLLPCTHGAMDGYRKRNSLLPRSNLLMFHPRFFLADMCLS